MAANVKLYGSFVSAGLASIRTEIWRIGTYAANGNAFGIVVAPNPSRRRLRFQLPKYSETDWTLGNVLKFCPEATPTGGFAAGIDLIAPRHTRWGVWAMVGATATGGTINAPAGVGTYDVQDLEFDATEGTPSLFAPGSDVFELGTYKGPVYIAWGGAGVQDKTIQLVEESD